MSPDLQTLVSPFYLNMKSSACMPIHKDFKNVYRF